MDLCWATGREPAGHGFVYGKGSCVGQDLFRATYSQAVSYTITTQHIILLLECMKQHKNDVKFSSDHTGQCCAT